MTDAEIEALLLSLRIALVAVAGALPFAVAIAWLLARTRFPGRVLLDGLVHLPLVLPPVVVGYLLLLPAWVWGVCFDYFRTVAVGLGPQVAVQAGINSWTIEGVALGYQMGFLMLPGLSVVLIWAWLCPADLNALMGKTSRLPAARVRSRKKVRR